ncbi:MAG: class I SAM-dependent methyltransferase [Planctomycetes bacterium]|nr:class I SAM-dependent methyltransferase [Planctomycetota bacterium]
MLANRLKKRYKQLRKWAKRREISCFRLYERDIPEYPLIIDWYDGHLVVWFYDRTRDESDEQKSLFQDQVYEELVKGFEIDAEKIWLKSRKKNKGLEQYEKCDQRAVEKLVVEQGLKFKTNLSDYVDTGLFLDHRPARAALREYCSGLRVLNLFAYTGSFSVYALSGGAASVTTVDMSQNYCAWARDNMELNGFGLGENNKIVNRDCLAYLSDALNNSEVFDIIICDPPTFSNSKKMSESSFVIDRDHISLLSDCAQLLSQKGFMLFSNNSRKFKLMEDDLPDYLHIQNSSSLTVPYDFRNRKIHQSWCLSTCDTGNDWISLLRKSQ